MLNQLYEFFLHSLLFRLGVDRSRFTLRVMCNAHFRPAQIFTSYRLLLRRQMIHHQIRRILPHFRHHPHRPRTSEPPPQSPRPRSRRPNTTDLRTIPTAARDGFAC